MVGDLINGPLDILLVETDVLSGCFLSLPPARLLVPLSLRPSTEQRLPRFGPSCSPALSNTSYGNRQSDSKVRPSALPLPRLQCRPRTVTAVAMEPVCAVTGGQSLSGFVG